MSAHYRQPPVVPGYDVDSLIARGSSATVWAATSESGEGDLAIKVVPVSHAEDEECLALEVAALSSAGRRNDHVVEVLDVVAVTEPVPGVAIVMERLRHGTLARLVTIRGHLTPGEVVTVLTPVALALAELHDAAVVHGDLSAANIGFDATGRPIVLDLGVCTVLGTDREQVYGTPGFIAPEVIGGGPATPAADVYAIGALGWYALAGALPPIPAERIPLRELAPATPAALADAIEQALDPDPASRGTARDLATAVYATTSPAPIVPVAGDDPAVMLTHRVRELARAAEPEPVMSRRERHTELRSRARAVHVRMLTMFVAVVLLGAAGIAIAMAGRAPAPVAPALTRAPVDYTAIVQDLVDARAVAWTHGDPALLPNAFAEGSETLRSDESRIGEAVAGGHTYEGLEFAVATLEVLSESDETVRLRTRLETSEYAVRTGDESEQRPAATSRLVLTLVRAGEEWRIGEVAPAS